MESLYETPSPLSTDSRTGATVRAEMKSFWLSYSQEPNVTKMLLDSNAENIGREELPEVLSLLPDMRGKNILELAGGIGLGCTSDDDKTTSNVEPSSHDLELPEDIRNLKQKPQGPRKRILKWGLITQAAQYFQQCMSNARRSKLPTAEEIASSQSPQPSVSEVSGLHSYVVLKKRIRR